MILVEILKSLKPGLGLGRELAQWRTVPVQADLSLLPG